ncbi:MULTISPECIES: ABC transporter substrate-binding protein [Halanaerobium]|jgi:peptide/nickel transport system substrate-binding protein|uniref:Peptide/nickel transport system substrate-binding protein n=1 Tax=Halanaerobium saccharolyticum TaxID=43595 RepID=A0A4V3CV20_9FIRM|nr:MULTISPECIES: ABC transporter substrate-binding protein [Halanaerobium]PUU88980.1 MAG: peptide/nickel transport system substrate-binding protein [Halanaerobium sp.]TDP80778.1 peptide/nickel transport system substrate-binding protein [Halanaerobium saccharolyticum]
MQKKLVVFLTLLLVVSVFSVAGAQEVKNPNTFTYVTIGDQSTLDPHFAYDTGSSELIYQVYETLIDYEGSSVQDFVPLLSTEVPSFENGLISEDGTDYTFVIREGVEFSNGNPLTAEDVKYSFLRGMIMDRSGGPIWMLYEPLFGAGYAGLADVTADVVGVEDPKQLTDEQAAEVLAVLKEKITVDGNKVTFHLAAPYPPFLNIVAKGASWGSILDKEWSIEQGAWDGTATDIVASHDPVKEEDPLFDKMLGTGPFILTEWVNGDHVVFRRNDNYWGELANFKTAIIRNVDEWSTRKLMLLRGDADMIYAPTQYRSQVEGEEGVVVTTGIPVLQNMNMVFNWEITTEGNNYIGSGKLDGKGIPSNFFADEDVRKAFSYSFNYQAFLEQVRMGEAIQLRGPIVDPLLGYNENSDVYSLDLEKAEEHFRKAFGGELWEKGFTMDLVYNSGNDPRKTAADMLKSYIERINPKFNINVRGVQWSTYLDASVRGTLPASFGGWLADFPDPHNFVQPFLDSAGYYAGRRGDAYKKWAEEVGINDLISEGISTTDTARRKEIYTQLQQMSIDHAIDLWIDQPTGSNTRRTWVEGWYPNAMRPGVDFYSMDKVAQ